MTVLDPAIAAAVAEILDGLEIPEPRDEEEGGILLPAAFWEARPAFGHIRRAAHARSRCPDVVLHAVLARVAGAIPHTLKLPAVVGTRAPLCFFNAACGPSGCGKSSAVAIAAELLPVGEAVIDQLPVGSGEGLVEMLFSMVAETDDQGKPVTVKRQTRYNVVVYVDEGAVLTALGTRAGSTLLPTLRSIWSGQPLGQANASADRRRLVPAGQYTYGVVLGLQPELAGPLLDDTAAGTPQRFCWSWALDPSIPDEAPPWPGELRWTAPDPGRLHELRTTGGGYVAHELPVAAAVVAEIRTRSLAQVRGEVEVDPADAHGDLLRLKVAALLGLLDGRVEVSDDDWALAGVVADTSRRVRRHVAALVAADASERERATSERLARRQVTATTAIDSDRLGRTARRIADIVRAEPEGIGVRTVQRRMSRRQVEVFQEALAVAVREGWLTEHGEPGQGADKRILRAVVERR